MNWLANAHEQARTMIRRPVRVPDAATRELLGFVARNECFEDEAGESHTYLSEVFGLSDPWQTVTAEIAEAKAAGWVDLAELPRGVKLWQLTDAGRRIASKLD